MEILAPCGSKEAFFAAVNAECDAVYLGLEDFSARKNAENFSLENLSYYIAYAHIFNVKVYVCVNTLVKDSELEKFFFTVLEAYRQGVDAFIVQDMFLGKLLKEQLPQICLHLSTQAGVNNLIGAKLAKEYGFDRVVLARETDAFEIESISKIIDTEVFVHGALCTSLSGHCYFSAFIGGMSGNRGQCRQPCRQKYQYIDKAFKRSGYELSLADLCLKDKLKKLEQIGVKSCKIEGRMRSPEYVYTSTKLYKQLSLGQTFDEQLFSQLKRSFNRGNYTCGYTFSEDKELMSRKVASHIGEYQGKIYKYSNGYCLVKGGKFTKGDGFKLFRQKEEIGGAFAPDDGDYIKTQVNVAVGDEVFLTKDIALSEAVGKLKRTKELYVEASFFSGERAVIKCGNIEVYSEEILTEADKFPLTLSEVESNLNRTDIYPFSVVNLVFNSDNKAFMPKAQLNKLRKTFFETLFYSNQKVVQYAVDFNQYLNKKSFQNDRKKSFAVITSSCIKLPNSVTELIFAPTEYNQEICSEFIKAQNFGGEKYLYVPAFLSTSDIEIIKRCVNCGFDGIYAEGLFGVELANELSVKLFGGVELNVFNEIDENTLKSYTSKFCISKELAENELSETDGYRLAIGSIKVMSLEYCPFARECKECKHSNLFTLEDYAKRQFPVRRFKLGKCRFEVFNEAIILSKREYPKMLIDLSGLTQEEGQRLLNCFSKGIEDIKKEFKCTLGRLVKGVE